MLSEAFHKWVDQSPIKLQCEAKEVEHGNGLVFGEESDTAVSVPSEMVISPQLVLEYSEKIPLLKRFLHRTDQGVDTDEIDLSPRKYLVRFLLVQILLIRRGTPDEKFGPWVQSLPPVKNMDLPTGWEKDRIDKELEGTSIYAATLGKVRHFTSAYEQFFAGPQIKKEIHDFVAAGKRDDLDPIYYEISFDDWHLVDQWISSRSLTFPTEAGIDLPVMVPVIDLANYARIPTACYSVNDEGGVDLIALTHKKGEEVTINYGVGSGAGEFLFKYGFIPDDMKTARKVVYHVDKLDDEYRQCLDEEYDPKNTRESENEDDINPDESYDILLTLYGQRLAPLTFSDLGAKRTWHDDFLCLHCCGSDISALTNPEEQSVVLCFRDKPIDMSNVQQFLQETDAEFFDTVVKPRGNQAVKQMLERIYLKKQSSASQLYSLEQTLLESIHAEVIQNCKTD